MFNDVSLWFAKDADGNIIIINEVEYSKKQYFCPLCESTVIPKSLKSKLISPHFAHIDASKCTSESIVHWWVKNSFIACGDEISIFEKDCKKYKVKGIEYEKTYNTSYGDYRPDISLITECGKTFFIEIAHSSTKDVAQYESIWQEIGNTVIEVSTSRLMDCDKKSPYKAIWYPGLFVFSKDENKEIQRIQRTVQDYMNKSLKANPKKVESIRNLRWLWEDVVKYKRNVVDIEYIFNLLQMVDDSAEYDSDLVFYILSKKSCIQALVDSLIHSISVVNSILKNSIDKNNYTLELGEVCKEYGKTNYYFKIKLKECNRCIHRFNLSYREVFPKKIIPLVNSAILKREKKKEKDKNKVFELRIDEYGRELSSRYFHRITQRLLDEKNKFNNVTHKVYRVNTMKTGDVNKNKIGFLKVEVGRNYTGIDCRAIGVDNPILIEIDSNRIEELDYRTDMTFRIDKHVSDCIRYDRYGRV